MFRPTLKRNTLSTSNKTYPPKKLSLHQNSQSTQNQNVKIIPQCFLQQSQQAFLKINSHQSKMAGMLNTIEFHYPQEVQQQIRDPKNAGQILLSEGIFCYYKQNNVYFWRYSDDQLLTPKKYFKQELEEQVTSVAISQVCLDGNVIILVAISIGYRIRLFRLKNFQMQKIHTVPDLQDLMIIIISMDIVNKLEIITIPFGFKGQMNSLIVFGDISGNVSLFDLNKKRKHVNDTWKKYMARVLSSNIRTQTHYKQILYHQGYLYCLCQTFYNMDSLHKKLLRLFRKPQGLIKNQQFIQIYQLKMLRVSNNNNQWPQITIQLQSFIQTQKISASVLSQRIRNSYGNSFQNHQQKDTKDQIDSISTDQQYISILFQSKSLIKIDHNISFPGKPEFIPVTPQNLSFCLKQKDFEKKKTNQSIKASLGSKIQLMEEYIVSGMNTDMIHYSIFCKPSLKLPFKMSVWSYNHKKHNVLEQKNSQYILFGNQSIYLVQKITRPQILMMYSMVYTNESFQENDIIPQQKNLNKNIHQLVEYWGAQRFMYELIKVLSIKIKASQYETFIRNDINQILKHELVQGQRLDTETIRQKFINHDRQIFKRKKIVFNSTTQQILWNIFYEVGHTKITVQRIYDSQINNIEAASIAFQIYISKILIQISKWDNLTLCFNRKKVYNAIQQSQIMIRLINTYITKLDKKQNRSFKFTMQNIQTSESTIKVVNPLRNNSIKSPQIRFYLILCQVLNKTITMLKLYDYICEYSFNNPNQIPPISKVLLSLDEETKILFSKTIIKKLDLNNDSLMDLLSSQIPELQIPLVRRYLAWLNIYQKNSANSNNAIKYDNQKTNDEILQDEAYNLQELLIPEFYSTFFTYFITNNPISKRKQQNKNTSNLEGQINYGLSKALNLLLATLTKINELKHKQIRIKNNFDHCLKNTNDYFSVMQIPSMKYQQKQTNRSRLFLIGKCQQIMNSIIQWYKQKKLDKKAVQKIFETIKNQLTFELRHKFKQILSRNQIQELSSLIKDRQIFINIGRSEDKNLTQQAIAKKQIFRAFSQQ